MTWLSTLGLMLGSFPSGSSFPARQSFPSGTSFPSGESWPASAAPAPVTPASILGALLYADWDARAGITIGTGVSNWADQVAGKNALQGVGIAQPTYGAASYRGGPGIAGDASNDVLRYALAPTFGAGARPYIWMAGARAGADIATAQPLTLSDNTGGFLNNALYWRYETNFRGLRCDAGAFDLQNITAVDNANHIWEIGYTSSGTATWLIDATSVNSARVNGLSAAVTDLMFFGLVGARFSSLITPRIIVASDLPSAAQITAMRSYMNGPNHTGYTASSYV